MPTSQRKQLELKVGITVAIALLLLALTIFTVEKFHFGQAGYPIEVAFGFVDAIKPQSDVVIGGGVKIGRVEDIHVAGDQVILKVILDKKVRLPLSAKFQILSKGVMGDKYLNVEAKADNGPYIQPGQLVQGVEPNNLDSAFAQLGQVADSLKKLLGNAQMAGSISGLVKNISDLAGRLDGIVERNEKNIDRGIRNISSAAGTINSFSKDIEKITRSLDQVLSTKNVESLGSIITNLDQLSKRLDEQMRQVEASKGTLGALLNDQKMANELKALVKDVKDHPWKLLWKQ